MCTREIDGRAAEFGTTGYTMDHVFVLYDRASDSVWYPLDDTSLQAVAGERKGGSIPCMDEPAPIALGDWLDANPDSTILLPTEEDYKRLNRPYLGIWLEDQDGGVIIEQVSDDSPAAAAGFEAGDVLRRFDGQVIESRRGLLDALTECAAGDTVKVVVERGGRKKTLRPTLEKP